MVNNRHADNILNTSHTPAATGAAPAAAGRSPLGPVGAEPTAVPAHWALAFVAVAAVGRPPTAARRAPLPGPPGGLDAAARPAHLAALRHDPVSVRAANGLARMVATEGRPAEAARCWHRSLAVGPHQPALRRALSRDRGRARRPGPVVTH
jgi:hypothetical protein